MTATHVDRAVEAIARRQHFVVSRRQAAGVGATNKMIHLRVRSGQWRRLDHEVYALEAGPRTWHQRLMAAVLAERVAVVSRSAAAALHELPGFGRGFPEITVPRGSNTRSRLALAHRSDDVESTSVDGIPVTSPTSTLFDLAATVGANRLRRATTDALDRGLLTVHDLESRAEQLHGRHRAGLAAMVLLIDTLAAGHGPGRSALERLLHHVLLDPRVPAWVAESPFPWDAEAPSRVDVFVPAWGLIIEADSRRWHARVDDFARDRARDNAAAAHGYRVLRFTWDDLTRHPDRVLRTILLAGRLAA